MLRHRDYITQDRRICGGQPVIKGTRVTLRTVLASLAQGSSIDELLREFPSLSEEGVRAAIAFAAASAQEDIPFPSFRTSHENQAGRKHSPCRGRTA